MSKEATHFVKLCLRRDVSKRPYTKDLLLKVLWLQPPQTPTSKETPTSTTNPSDIRRDSLLSASTANTTPNTSQTLAQARDHQQNTNQLRERLPSNGSNASTPIRVPSRSSFGTPTQYANRPNPPSAGSSIGYGRHEQNPSAGSVRHLLYFYESERI